MEKAVSGIYMFILMQQDLQKGVDFYTKLGLKVVFCIPGKWAELEINGLKIGLCPAPTVETGRHSGLVFQVEDLQAAYDVLKKEEFPFVNEPTVATHGIMVSCTDPSGNMFDLYQPTHDKVKKALEEAGVMCKGSCGKNGQGACCKTVQKSNGCC